MKTDDDNDFDAMLRTAMTSRPEPPDATNLAARAIAMAREERRATMTPRVAPLARTLTTLAATIAAVAVLVAGYVKLAALASLDATTSATSASSSTTDLAPTLVVGGVGLIVTLLVLACRGMLAGDDDAIRWES